MKISPPNSSLTHYASRCERERKTSNSERDRKTAKMPSEDIWVCSVQLGVCSRFSECSLYVFRETSLWMPSDWNMEEESRVVIMPPPKQLVGCEPECLL